MKTILMVRCKMDEYDYLARLNGLSVRRIEEKATSAYLSAYPIGKFEKTAENVQLITIYC